MSQQVSHRPAPLSSSALTLAPTSSAFLLDAELNRLGLARVEFDDLGFGTQGEIYTNQRGFTTPMEMWVLGLWLRLPILLRLNQSRIVPTWAERRQIYQIREETFGVFAIAMPVSRIVFCCIVYDIRNTNVAIIVLRTANLVAEIQRKTSIRRF
ncbi:hypothetical protein C8J56DRAFT_893184 [Mycena floridula]|nr:hypothetical protein C8J56DRAFT_893184 [Mycena floridula]